MAPCSRCRRASSSARTKGPEPAAALGPGHQGCVDRVAEGGGKIRAPPPQRLDRTADPAGGLRRVVAAHGVVAGEGLIQDQGQRVDVRGLARGLAFGLLRGHVGERPEDVAGAREDVLAGEARTAEVGQLRRLGGLLAPVRDEHVLGLDVAVDDAAGVGVGEGPTEGDADLEHLAVEDAPIRDQACERGAFDQLGDQVHGAVADARLVQRHDRGVRQAGARERLTHRPLAVVPGSEGDPLQGHLALQQLVRGPPHDAEAARAEALVQPVALQHELPGGRGAGRRAPEDAPRGRLERRLGWCAALDQCPLRVHRIARSPWEPALLARGVRKWVGMSAKLQENGLTGAPVILRLLVKCLQKECTFVVL